MLTLINVQQQFGYMLDFLNTLSFMNNVKIYQYSPKLMSMPTMMVKKAVLIYLLLGNTPWPALDFDMFSSW